MPTRYPEKKMTQDARSVAKRVDDVEERVVAAEKRVAEVVERVESSHKIHADGTYSNTNTATTRKLQGTLKKNMILSFGAGPYRWATVVHKITDRGVFCRPDLHVEPDKSGCRFYTWEEINRDVMGAA